MPRKLDPNEDSPIKGLHKAPKVLPGDIQSIPPFEPNQLITAPQLNRLVEALKALDSRLAKLERR
jgi:hypothetical protein